MQQEQAILAAIEQRTQTFEDLADAINRYPDPQRAFELATLLADTERDLTGRGAELRARQAHRIYEAEEMSLTELGKRIGNLSKQRALKMLQTVDSKPTPEEKP